MNNYHYLLRDSNEIFGIYTSLETAYNHLLQFLYNLQRYHKIITGNSCSIKPVLGNFQIIQYEDNSVVNLFNISTNFKLTDINLQQLTFSKLSIIDFISKLEQESNLNIDSNDLNLFIPINFTETEIKNIIQPPLFQSNQQTRSNFVSTRNIAETESSTESSTDPNIIVNDVSKELQELQTKIELLDAMKNSEKLSLDKIKENIKSKEEQVILEKVKTETIKQKLERKKEYYDKTKSKFKIDKEIYFKLKKEIDDGERSPDKLPELFVDEFKIFSQMELDNLLDLELSDNAFKEYIKHKPEKKKNFSTNFDNIFENDNWGNINEKEDSESDSELEEIVKINQKRELFIGGL